MHYSKLETDLRDAYIGKISLNQLIQRNEKSIRQISNHAIRYKTDWLLSDEDDIYQEACYWLINCMWNWDESKGVSLYRYVVYNIGIRLASHIKSEKALYRHPVNSIKLNIWGPITNNQNNDYSISNTLESNIPSPNTASPECIVAIHETIKIADSKLTKLAIELTIALLEESGYFSSAVKRLLKKEHIKKRFGPDYNHLHYTLKTKVLPEILQFFSSMDIIPL